jgi:predicted RNase H-like HicB family nuclease
VVDSQSAHDAIQRNAAQAQGVCNGRKRQRGVIYGSAALKHLNHWNIVLSKVMPKKVSKSRIADRYAKIVEWSDEDGCYIGRVPALSYGGVHGSDRAAVFLEICQVAEEVVELMLVDGRKLPNPEQKNTAANLFCVLIPVSTRPLL